MTRVLVAGTYPPVPGEASRATLAEVRRALAEGFEVEVVSSRPTAAHHVGGLRGVRCAATLRRLRRRRCFDRVVLCLEPDLPFVPGAPRWVTAIALTVLRMALQGFDAAELITFDGLEPASAVRRLAATPGVAVRKRPAPVDGTEMMATPHGPAEWLPGERRAHARVMADHALYRVEVLASRSAKAVLGRRAVGLGPPLRRLVHPLRSKPETPAESEDDYRMPDQPTGAT